MHNFAQNGSAAQRSRILPKVISGELIVVGAVYDFRDDLKQGQGKLAIVNVNGETDARKLAQLEIVQAMEQPAPRARRGATAY